MKTADEILSKYWIDEYNKAGVRTGGHIIFQKDAVEAMEEYANTRLQELSLTDMAEEYIKKELPNAEKPFHYDAEGAVCIRDFVKWARNKIQEQCK